VNSSRPDETSRSCIIPGRRMRRAKRIERITEAGAALSPENSTLGVAHASDWRPHSIALGAAKTGGVIVLPEPAVMDQSRATIAEMALRHRLPTAFTFSHVRRGWRPHILRPGPPGHAQALGHLRRERF